MSGRATIARVEHLAHGLLQYGEGRLAIAGPSEEAPAIDLDRVEVVNQPGWLYEAMVANSLPERVDDEETLLVQPPFAAPDEMLARAEAACARVFSTRYFILIRIGGGGERIFATDDDGGESLNAAPPRASVPFSDSGWLVPLLEAYATSCEQQERKEAEAEAGDRTDELIEADD